MKQKETPPVVPVGAGWGLPSEGVLLGIVPFLVLQHRSPFREPIRCRSGLSSLVITSIVLSLVRDLMKQNGIGLPSIPLRIRSPSSISPPAAVDFNLAVEYGPGVCGWICGVITVSAQPVQGFVSNEISGRPVDAIKAS